MTLLSSVSEPVIMESTLGTCTSRGEGEESGVGVRSGDDKEDDTQVHYLVSHHSRIRMHPQISGRVLKGLLLAPLKGMADLVFLENPAHARAVCKFLCGRVRLR